MLSWIRISKRDGSNIYPKSMKSSNPVFLSKGCQMLLVSNKKIGAVLFRIHMVVQFKSALQVFLKIFGFSPVLSLFQFRK